MENVFLRCLYSFQMNILFQHRIRNTTFYKDIMGHYLMYINVDEPPSSLPLHIKKIITRAEVKEKKKVLEVYNKCFSLSKLT